MCGCISRFSLLLFVCLFGVAFLEMYLLLSGILAGGQLTSMDQMTGTPNHKSTARQRWTPSQHQLQILERLFEQGSGTPNKQRIKEITAELSQHGAISETNVYNWFQNRKARAKRKQQLVLFSDLRRIGHDICQLKLVHCLHILFTSMCYSIPSGNS